MEPEHSQAVANELSAGGGPDSTPNEEASSSRLPEAADAPPPPPAASSNGHASRTRPAITVEKEKPDHPLAKISHDFYGNIRALRHFSERIGPMADAQDKETIERFFKGLLDALSLKLAPTGDGDSMVVPVDVEVPEGAASVVDHERLAQHVKRVLAAPDARDRLAEEVLKYKPEISGSGDLLRRSALLTSVSYVDIVVAQLIRVYYKKYPGALPAKTRRLSLSDLRELGSVGAAEEYILDRRIDTILRRSLSKQLEFFTKRLKLDLQALTSLLANVVEVMQRRHVLVHNGGIVNRAYLDRVKPQLATELGLKLGDPVVVDGKYLQRAIDLIQFLGVVLLQTCWRSWYKDQTTEADVAVNDAIYEAISEDRFELACRLGEFGRDLKHSDDAHRRMIVLNLAQAYKWSGNQELAVKTVDGADWSSCGLSFKLGLCAIRDELTEFFRLLPLALAAKEITVLSLKQWPIFREVRKDARFATAVSAPCAQSVTPELAS